MFVSYPLPLTPAKPDLSDNPNHLFDPWEERILQSKHDSLAHFLDKKLEDIRYRPTKSNRQKSFAKAQSIVRSASDYVFDEGSNHASQESSSFKLATLNGQASDSIKYLDVFGRNVKSDFDKTVFEWLEGEASIIGGTPAKTLKIDSLLSIFPEQREGILIGMSESKIFTWLGKPDRLRRVGSVVTWQYVNEDCVLNVYLYSVDKVPLNFKSNIDLSNLNKEDRIATFAESYRRESINKSCG